LARQRGISVNKLLTQNGLAKSTVSNMKSGRGIPTADKLAVMAMALGTDIFDLLGMEQTKNETQNYKGENSMKNISDKMVTGSTICANIAKELNDKGMTRVKMFNNTGVTKEQFDDWANGASRPTIAELRGVADYLGITVDNLLGYFNIPYGGEQCVCPLCKSTLNNRRIFWDGEIFEYSCPNCGEYKTDLELLGKLFGNERDKKWSDACARMYLISGITRYNSDRGNMLALSVDFFHDLFDCALIPQTAMDKLDILLVHCFDVATAVNEFVKITYPAICFGVDESEMKTIIDFAIESKYLEKKGDNGYWLTLKGHERCAEIKKQGKHSNTAFVAMWFNEETDDLYKIIKGVIERHGYKAERVDHIPHNNGIPNEIIAQINSSRFVVADLTGQRGGVYYEQGYAKGRGKDVVQTCRESDFEKIHFDLKQVNTIKWKANELEKFAYALSSRIEGTIGSKLQLTQQERWALAKEVCAEVKDDNKKKGTDDILVELLKRLDEMEQKMVTKADISVLDKRVAALEPGEQQTGTSSTK
jgi:transcriptional regulator with XRE-family HTH domain